MVAFAGAQRSRVAVPTRQLKPPAMLSLLVATVSLTAAFAFGAGFVEGARGKRSSGAEATGVEKLDPDSLTMLAAKEPLFPLFPKVLPGPSPKEAVVTPKATNAPVPVLEPLKPKSITHPAGWPCNSGEKLFMSLCYVDCGKATSGVFTQRTDSCTCCKAHPCLELPGMYNKDCLMFNRGADGNQPESPRLTNCKYEHEELWGGLCYMKCSLLTESKYPHRTGMNTCSDDTYGGNWTMGFGPCSGFGIGGDNCMPHIPSPSGMGFPMHDKSQVGHPPLGFGRIPALPPVPVSLVASPTA